MYWSNTILQAVPLQALRLQIELIREKNFLNRMILTTCAFTLFRPSFLLLLFVFVLFLFCVCVCMRVLLSRWRWGKWVGYPVSETCYCQMTCGQPKGQQLAGYIEFQSNRPCNLSSDIHSEQKYRLTQ